jgi:glycosyltransferase involved in cell wall biosynthesis
LTQPIDYEMPVRIAFSYLGSERWTAGAHYLKNLLSAAKSLTGDQRPELVLLTSALDQGEDLDGIRRLVDHVITYPSRLEMWERQLTRVQERSFVGAGRLITRYLRNEGCDAIFSSTEFGRAFGIPLIAWIPDFQHLHLPELFSEGDVRGRNRCFRRIAHNADRIVLSSKHARSDFAGFAPHSAGKARVLPFVAQQAQGCFDDDPLRVCSQYHLPERFIYLPNQFWKHKNHETVIRALALAQVERPSIAVVCTGHTWEYRDPYHLGRLLGLSSSLGVRDRFILLGLVPHEHVFQLVRQSLAVLQPSLFEGWSTVVEEVKSIGKSMILSDIPVHREQDPAECIFFDPVSARDLADKLVQMYDAKQPGPDVAMEAAALRDLPARTRAFGQGFMAIVEEAIG